MLSITVETEKNSRTQDIAEDQAKKFISIKLIEMLKNKNLHSVTISKSNTVMYIFTNNIDT
jgi:hypothetical protein